MQKYRTLVVDPPWAYNDKLMSGNSGFGKRNQTRGAANHYSVMTLDEMRELPVAEWADEPSHLYLWTTNAFMVEAHELAEAWGFTQKTILTWVKPQIGMGWYYRNNTEHVLFCVRGTLPPLRRNQPTSFVADRRRHSEKPREFYDIVESMSPGPYIDIFARKPRDGWAAWGNEVQEQQ